MTVTVLYPEGRQIPDLALEQEVFGPEVRIVRAAKPSFAELDPNDCAAADGLMIMRWAVTAADLDRFPRLRCVVRMGVGYDKLDREALAGRDILVCNVPVRAGTPSRSAASSNSEVPRTVLRGLPIWDCAGSRFGASKGVALVEHLLPGDPCGNSATTGGRPRFSTRRLAEPNPSIA